MKRLALLTLTILATAAAFVLAWLLWDVFVLFFVSVALATALRPLVIQMRGWNLKDGVAILICYVALVLFLVGGFFIFGSILSNDVAVVLDRFPDWYDGLQTQLAAGAMWQQTVASYLPSSDVLIRAIAASNVGAGASTLLALSLGLLNLFIFVIGVLSLGYYWLVDQSRFERLWLSLLPVSTRVRARSIWQDAEREIGTYIRVELLIVATVALVLLGVYSLLGLPFAALLALASGSVQLLPWLGGSLMLILSFGVALSTGNVNTALIVLTVGVVQEIALAFVVRPQLYRNVRKLNSLLVVVMLLALGSLGGPLAALLAQPLAVLVQVVYQNTVLNPQRLVRPDALPELDRLTEQAEDLEATIIAQENPPLELRSLVQRVRGLLGRAREVVTVGGDDSAQRP